MYITIIYSHVIFCAQDKPNKSNLQMIISSIFSIYAMDILNSKKSVNALLTLKSLSGLPFTSKIVWC